MVAGFFAEVIGTGVSAVAASNDQDNTVIEWYHPYYKCVEVYEKVGYPGHYIAAVTGFSGNQTSYLHAERHWEAYYPNKTKLLYAWG